MSSHADAQWTEPPWSGWIETTGDALLILEAARRGLIPRVTRRLVDGERKMIASGSVFVFDEKESGIKRWTDGFFWSPSRILGNFLLYRETDKRGSGHRGRGEGDDSPPGQPEYPASTSTSLSRPRTDGNMLGVDKMRERSLMGSLTNSYKFKSDGLMKKTFSLHIDGAAQHLISYYRIEDVESGRLRSPSSLPELASLDISPELLDKTHFRNPPKVEIGPDGIPRYRGEADDIDPSPTILTAPLSTGLPLLTDGHYTTDKRSTKRFDPYGPPPSNKRRRAKSDDPSSSAPGSTEATQTSQTQPLLQAPQPYPDTSHHQMVQSSQSQSQSPLSHQPTSHPHPPHHPYATPYTLPSNVHMGYYPYPSHPIYTSPYPPGTTGSPIPAVPPSTQPTPSPPVTSSSTSTTPTPAKAGEMSSSPTTSASASAGTQLPSLAPTPTPYPYSYPHPFHHQAAVSTVGAADANASANVNNVSQSTETQSQSQGLQVQAQAQTQAQPHPQSSNASIAPTAHVPTTGTNIGTGGANPAVPRPMHAPVHPAAYYPYYPPPGMYQPYPWYGYVPGQTHMQPHMQQHQVQVQAQQQQHQVQVQGQVPIQGVVQQQQQQGVPVPVDVAPVADNDSDASADGME